MPKETRCYRLLNARVSQRIPNGWKNLLNICLVHMFAHSTQAILRMHWMLDREEVPGVHDSCKYLLEFKKN